MLPIPTGRPRIPLGAVLIVLSALALTACDKCGNSLLRVDAGPLVCKEQGPR